jgi:NAD(P)-dependent dehydrogenase (short-subunit alcohol dehydrogenase family)
MAASLKDRVIVVVGAGRGLGKDFALRIAAAGARVVVAARTERELGETVGEIVFGGGKARHVVLDATRSESTRVALPKLIAPFGSVDAVVVAVRDEAVRTACHKLGAQLLAQSPPSAPEPVLFDLPEPVSMPDLEPLVRDLTSLLVRHGASGAEQA